MLLRIKRKAPTLKSSTKSLIKQAPAKRQKLDREQRYKNRQWQPQETKVHKKRARPFGTKRRKVVRQNPIAVAKAKVKTEAMAVAVASAIETVETKSPNEHKLACASVIGTREFRIPQKSDLDTVFERIVKRLPFGKRTKSRGRAEILRVMRLCTTDFLTRQVLHADHANAVLYVLTTGIKILRLVNRALIEINGNRSECISRGVLKYAERAAKRACNGSSMVSHDIDRNHIRAFLASEDESATAFFVGFLGSIQEDCRAYAIAAKKNKNKQNPNAEIDHNGLVTSDEAKKIRMVDLQQCKYFLQFNTFFSEIKLHSVYTDNKDLDPDYADGDSDSEEEEKEDKEEATETSLSETSSDESSNDSDESSNSDDEVQDMSKILYSKQWIQAAVQTENSV